MKKYLTAAALAFLVPAVLALFAAPSILGTGSAEVPPAETTIVFEVEGMTCGGCEVGVRLNVKKLDGVKEVEASYEEGLAKVTYETDRVTPEQIEAAIEILGYEAEIQEPEEDADEERQADNME